MKRKHTGAQGSADPSPRQLADPIVDGLLEGNLLPAELTEKPLMFKVPVWPNHAPSEATPETVQGFWIDDPLDKATLEAPADFPIELYVPVAKLTEGPHTLRYVVTQDGNTLRSQDIPINIDLIPPQLGTPNVLVFPQEIQDNGVTTDYLEAHQNKLEVPLPDYPNPVARDVITVYWDTNDNDNNAMPPKTVEPGDIGQTIVLTIPGDKIIESGSGPRKVRYDIRDYAGNTSGYAGYADVNVDLDDGDGGEDPVLLPMQFYDGDIVDVVDGTLNKDVVLKGDGLRVRIPAWNIMPIPDTTDTIFVDVAPGHGPEEPVWEQVQEFPVEGSALPTFPVDLVIDDEYLHPDSAFRVRYRVLPWYTNIQDYSPVLPLTTDTAPPWGLADPAFPGIPVDDITDDYLAANPDGIEWTVPAYPDFQPTDKGAYWYLAELPENPADLTEPTDFFDVTEVPLTVHVPEAVVREVGDGGCYLVYMLSDKATNISRISKPARLKVALDPLPQNLLPPVVPQAEGKDEIDLIDVHDGLIVAIPEFDNWKPTDKIRLLWGNAEMQGQDIGTDPAWPRHLRVPDTLVKLVYGDAEGPVETVFSYRVYRGDVIFGPFINTVLVNLSVAGPELPDETWPDPVNPNLGLAEVRGETSDTANSLARADTGQAAKFIFPMYTPAVAGEEVNFYWGETLVEDARYEVTGTEVAGDPITVLIPWEIIQAAGNNTALPVHYRIGHPDSPNEQYSRVTNVAVDAVVFTPPAPSFPDAIELPNGLMLNCGSLTKPQNSIRVQMPDLSAYINAGDIVKLKWTPYYKLMDQGGEEITAAILEEEHTVAPGEEAGFVWEVMPYEDHLLPTYVDMTQPAGHALVQYRIQFEGHEEASEIVRSNVAMHNTQSSCPL